MGRVIVQLHVDRMGTEKMGVTMPMMCDKNERWH